MVKLIDSITSDNTSETSDNIVDFIYKLDNGIFKSLKDSTNMCNLLLVKIKNKNGTFVYIKRSDGEIFIPTSDVLKKLNNELFINKNKLCAFNVSKGYINEHYDESNISLLLFSENINERTHESNYILCGLLFLKERSKKNIFIPLICCKPGIGSVFMVMAEKIAQDLGYDKLILNSMSDPLGFYIHKGYKFIPGQKIFELSKDHPIYLHKRKGDEIKTSYQDILKHAGYLNSVGHVITFNNRTRSLSRKVSGNLTRSQQLVLNTPINIIFGINTNANGHPTMYKSIKSLKSSKGNGNHTGKAQTAKRGRGRGRGRGIGSIRGKGKRRTRGRGRGGPSY